MQTNGHRQQIRTWVQLTRFDKPIGSYLLLWPTYWALWVAAAGIPSIKNLFIFTFGTVLMRSAGCIINDFADRHIDGHVKRTKERPLATGKISPKAALIGFALLCSLAFFLVCFTNALTIKLSLIGLLLAAFYPFSKRFTHWPQFFLGLAFSWGIPMSFAAERGSLSPVLWWLFSANLVWILVYDTIYAMVDRDDDLKIGVKSTAILFGKYDRIIIALLQLIVLILILISAYQLALGLWFYLCFILAAWVFIYQQLLLAKRTTDAYFQAFKFSHWFGWLIFVGLFLHYLSQN